MKWIDTLEIRYWADRRDCQDTLPHLLRKLIRANSNSIHSIKFPSGDNVLLGGWDGVLEVSEETEYLPLGISLWEFGANKDIKGKANSDYEKRTKNPLGYDPKDCTFIFVTTRLFSKADEWIREKKEERIWKDVRVVNAEILEEWLEQCPSVSSWLSIKHLRKYPEGVRSTDDFWDEWSTGPNLKLTPELILGGRQEEARQLFESASTPSIISIQGPSREEALAFIIIVFKASKNEEDFFSRSIIVDNQEQFRQLSIHNKPLILIPIFEDCGILNRAIEYGHNVIVPLGADSSNNWSSKIILPKLDREFFVKSLVESGLSKEKAEKYSRESARNITILRRQLEFVRNTPEWAEPDSVRDIIPAMIIGRWNESFESDKEIVSMVANEPYDDYLKKLKKWLYCSDSPIIKIGNNWRLVSPLDAWSNASRFLIHNDFDLLKSSFNKIMSEIDPAFKLKPEERSMASLHGKVKKYSEWIREGITQSLILTSFYGDELSFDLPIPSKIWVDNIIKELLKNNDNDFWKSINNQLPLISEASPDSFLDAIEQYLKEDNSPIINMFFEDPGITSGISYHTGLLWALENIAWITEYLPRVSLILAFLSTNDPGGSTSNRPFNSLDNIFKPWYVQTLADFKTRFEVLELLSHREKDVTWELLLGMLPDSSTGFAMPSHKFRWRMFNQQSKKPITYSEIYQTYSATVDLLLNICDKSEKQISQLIKSSIHLSKSDRDKIIEFIESNIDNIVNRDYSAWNALRDLINNHRSFPDAKWSVSEDTLKPYVALFYKLQPSDIINQSLWLFDDHFPKFIEGFKYKEISHEERSMLIHKARLEALEKIYETGGLDIILDMIQKVNLQRILGDILSNIITDRDEIITLCNLLNDEENQVIQGFIFRKSIIYDLEWIFKLYEDLKEKGLNDEILVRIFYSLNQNKDLWDFINSTTDLIRNTYWKNVYPQFYHCGVDDQILGIKYLLEYKRFFSAIDFCSHSVENLPTELIVDLLEKTATIKTDEKNNLQEYQFNQLFEELGKRKDINEKTLLRLEWYYIPVLTSYGSRIKPTLLHDELSTNTEFFMDILRFIYKPDNEEVEEETLGLSEEVIINRARQAHDLLESWRKIPGMDKEFNINFEELKMWVIAVKELSVKYNRSKVAYVHIGKILTKIPLKKSPWPPNEICEIIELCNSDVINRNFIIEVQNNRGITTRGAFEGGYQERELAKFFNEQSEYYCTKYPIVSTILKKISDRYEYDAKDEDKRAELDSLEY